MSMSRTILEYIKVFSVDAQRERTDDMADTHAKNVSLLVTPSEAQLVMLAKDKGILHLAMRSKNDTETAKASPIDEESLFGSLRQPINQLPIQKRLDADDEITGSDQTPEEIIRRELLDEQNQQVSQSKPSANVRPILNPDAPRWQVTVYSGSDKQVEEFELPLETETDGASDNAPRESVEKADAS